MPHAHRMTQDRDGNPVACIVCGLTPDDVEAAEAREAVGVPPSPRRPVEG